MKMLHHKVNIVPVIAKADMLTKKEVARLKKRVTDESNFFTRFVRSVMEIVTIALGYGGD